MSKPTEPGVLFLDEDDAHNYKGIKIPSNWITVVGERKPIVQIFNDGFRLFPEEPWYACVADDLICGPEGWDTELAKTCGRDKIAWGQDGINGHTNCCVGFIGGDLTRKIGWTMYPGLNHLYADNIWFNIQERLKIGVFRPSIYTEHQHWSTGKQPYDQTARERKIENDQATYEVFMSHFDEFIEGLQ